MQVVRLSGKIHKWLALAMAIQILFWFVSGLFFAAVPIERVRSEHLKAEVPAQPVALPVAVDGLSRIAAAPADKIEVRSLMGKPVAMLSRGEAKPELYDLTSGARISPLPAPAAMAIAQRDYAGPAKAVRALLVTENSPEYRGALPAWRVEFDDGGNRALYVAADTGMVAARRSTLWRTYDFLWSLHIMDFKGHEDFNNPLLIIATALSLIMIITGIIMFPSRLGYTTWRKRRRLRKAALSPAE